MHWPDSCSLPTARPHTFPHRLHVPWMLTVPATARVCLSVPLFTFLQHTSKNKPSDHYKNQLVSVQPHSSLTRCSATLMHLPGLNPLIALLTFSMLLVRHAWTPATCPTVFPSNSKHPPPSVTSGVRCIRRRALLRHVAEHPPSTTAPSAKRGSHVMVHLQRFVSLAQLQANTCGRMVPGCKQVLRADQVCQDRE